MPELEAPLTLTARLILSGIALGAVMVLGWWAFDQIWR